MNRSWLVVLSTNGAKPWAYPGGRLAGAAGAVGGVVNGAVGAGWRTGGGSHRVTTAAAPGSGKRLAPRRQARELSGEEGSRDGDVSPPHPATLSTHHLHFSFFFYQKYPKFLY